LDRIRFAAVGLGVMGQRRLEVLSQNAASQIVIVCDVDRSRAETTGKKYACNFSTHAEEAIARNDVDCVVISVPNKFHSSISISALQRGKHVFCEKPMANTSREAVDMVDAARANGVFLKVGSNHRFFPNVLKARSLVETGAIGKPVVFRGWIGHDGSKFGSAWFKDYELTGGGTLIDNGCHILDISRMLLGEAESCVAEVDNLLKHDIKPAEDYASVIYKTKNNGMISINCSWLEWYGYLYFEVYGDQGFLIADARYGNKLVWGKRDEDNVETFDYTNKPQQSYKLEMEHLVESLRKGIQPEPSGYDGMRVVQMIHAAYESSSTGRRTKV
jgi:UDP-N-acetylglucosamine 3-dehydrogenase